MKKQEFIQRKKPKQEPVVSKGHTFQEIESRVQAEFKKLADEVRIIN